MLSEILANFNWVDVLIIWLVVRTVFVGAKSNILVEVLSLFGTVCLTFIVLHYYVRFGEWLNKNVFLPAAIQDVFSFILLWLTVHIISKLIISGWTLIFRVEAQATLNEWGSAMVSAVKAFLICGLLFVFLLLSGSDYVRRISQQSFTGFYLMDFSPRVYRLMYDGVVARFFPKEPVNEQVFKLEKAHDGQKHKGERKKSEE